MARVEHLEELLGIEFKNVNLLKEALTHRSYLNEHPEWPLPQNERLEYLGDAVLELLVSEELFKLFPSHHEGQLTTLRAALVNYQLLGRVAKDIALDDYLYLSRGEARDFGKAREVILANAIEALLGAIYLDQGYGIAKEFVDRYVMRYLDEVLKKELYRDPKSQLQEIAQERFRITPTYRIISETGPDHMKRFVMGVYFGNEDAGQGEGPSKQEAEVQAAQNALKRLRDEGELE